MQGITPFLWFDTEAEEAVNFYVSLFPNSKVVATTRWGDTGPGPKGQVMTMAFDLNGQRFTALNGGPQFKFTEAVSLVVNCDSQSEIDTVWSKILGNGGKEQACGWIKDKYGLSWQIVPTILSELMTSKDGDKSKRVMAALMQMVKLDIQKLKDA